MSRPAGYTTDRQTVIMNNIAADFIRERTPEQVEIISRKSDRWYEAAELDWIACRLRIKPMAVRLREERKKAKEKQEKLRRDYLDESPCSTRPKVAAEYREFAMYGARGAEAARRGRKKRVMECIDFMDGMEA